MPPACASAIASRLSVTVSIAAETNGIFSLIVRVNRVSVLAAVGRLSVVTLGLPTQIYDPTVHYHQVRDVWIGVRTPDGR